MDLNYFKAESTENLIPSHSCKYEAPSNIALVKYWGKYEVQIPANPSISFTLKNSKTITKVGFQVKSEEKVPSFELLFEGESKPSFRPKIEGFLKRILPFCPYLKAYHLNIDTTNTFPHSSGIASSASGMAALSACIIDLEQKLFPEKSQEFYAQKMSFLARLGSGSAARSIQGPVMIWGDFHTQNSSDYFATPLERPLHSIFQDFQDAILIIHEGQKTVSSTVGHGLMDGHPFANQRFEQAKHHLASMVKFLEEGAMEQFIQLVELEALTLHAMMMSSNPYYILMQPNTLEAIQRIWAFRKEKDIPICFTLDAGANVHVLYPKKVEREVNVFIENDLKPLCSNGLVIFDEVGCGVVKV